MILEEVERGVDVLAEDPTDASTAIHVTQIEMTSPMRLSGSIYGVVESHIGGSMSLQSNIDLSDVDIYTAFKQDHNDDEEDNMP